MQSEESRRRGERFFRLHEQERPLVLIEASDGGSARSLERVGAAAVGVSVSGIAWSLGCERPEELLLTDFISACTRICRVVRVPVSVDLEDHRFAGAEDLGGLLAALIDIGVSGVDLHESALHPPHHSGRAATLPEHVATPFARARPDSARFFINVQIDADRDPFPNDGSGPDHQAVDRARLHASAGADGISVRGMPSGDVVRFVREVPIPVTIGVGDGWGPPIHGLARTGVRRITLRGGASSAAREVFRGVASEALGRGSYEVMRRHLPSGAGIIPSA